MKISQSMGSRAMVNGNGYKVKQLLKLADNALDDSFRQDGKAYYKKSSKNRHRYTNLGDSTRYTFISLIGLIEYKKYGFPPKINFNNLVNNLSNHLKPDEIQNIGDLGLALWLFSKNEKSISSMIFNVICTHGKPYTTSNNKVYGTMELSWLLSGLLEYYKTNQSKEIKEKIEESKNILIKNCFNDQTSLFYHSHKKKPVSWFNDQSYPIYALAKYYNFFGGIKVLDCTIHCAEKICSLQGPKGQWWWAYNVYKGAIADKYPVYSVHQDGMAPMALLKLSEISDRKFEYHVFKGLNWIYGKNELGLSMIDWDKNIIWRSIQRRNVFGTICSISMYKNLGRLTNLFPFYKVNYESRPYHYGWLLLAFSKYSNQEVKNENRSAEINA